MACRRFQDGAVQGAHGSTRAPKANEIIVSTVALPKGHYDLWVEMGFEDSEVRGHNLQLQLWSDDGQGEPGELIEVMAVTKSGRGPRAPGFPIDNEHLCLVNGSLDGEDDSIYAGLIFARRL